MKEIRFVDGLIYKERKQDQPDFVIGEISIKREELIKWLSMEQGEWVNLDVLRSKKGKPYVKVNEYDMNTQTKTEQPPMVATTSSTFPNVKDPLGLDDIKIDL